ncbi:MAG: methyltransferase domain-containing protein [Flavobacteriales bacterium]|nr:methyltransferase domain-containing protein [Flavobacteriales bacterium]
MQTKTFIAAPIQAKRHNQSFFEELISSLATITSVANPNQILNVPSTQEISQLRSQDIFSANLKLIASSDIFLAEISMPSLGVGFEISKARDLSKPIICIYDTSYAPEISIMIKGIVYENIHFIEYNDINDLIQKLSVLYEKLNLQQTDSVMSHFDELSPIYDKTTEWCADDNILDWFAEEINGKKKHLDLGCGTGLAVGKVDRSMTTIVGVDFSSGMIEQSKNRLDVAIIADACELPFLDGYFDSISIRQMLHYTNPNIALNEAYRVLKEGGCLLTAHISAEFESELEFWEAFKRLTQPQRRRYFTNENLLSLNRESGFQVLNSKSYFINRNVSWKLLKSISVNKEIVEIASEFIARLPTNFSGHFKLSDDGFEYRQHWSLINAKKS